MDISLSQTGYYTLSASDTKEAREILRCQHIDLVLLDLKLENESGLDYLQEIGDNYPDLPVLMITAFSETQSAVEAMKLGAKDFISKPFDLQDFLQIIQNTLQKQNEKDSSTYLKVEERGYFGDIIGSCKRMQRLFKMVKQVANTNINILITGESGTGKELIARAIHNQSDRREHSFVPINCGGIPETLFESELFGYLKGAFTGADSAKSGFLDLADQGTLFLDEVCELSFQSQVKLLRCLQECAYTPLGSNLEKRVNTRFIAATNKQISRICGTSFREDLFYRLSGVIIDVPPLRKRDEDILELASYFLQSAIRRQNKYIQGFSQKAINKLRSYGFPGNVRELENLVERAVALETGKTISPDSIIIYRSHQNEVEGHDQEELDPVLSSELTLDEYLQKKERIILKNAIEKAEGQKTEAAKLLGLNLRQIRYRLKKAGLET